VLANRLTEDPAVSVLLLEAGGRDKDPLLSIPLGWGKLLATRKYDWMYNTEPEPGLDNRRIETRRGKVLGGCSSINAMAFVRGHDGDYDRWRDMGLTEWSRNAMLPYLIRQETWEGEPSQMRGGSGPINVRASKYEDPAIEAFLQATAKAGYPTLDDYNSERPDGFGRIQSSIRDGRRCSTSQGYLRPAMHRSNLKVETGVLVSRLVMNGRSASGIEFVKDGTVTQVEAGKEVILSAGVIGSAQILMLSGVGPEDQLHAAGIEPVLVRNQVGQNLQDHLVAMVEHVRPEGGTMQRQMRLDRIAWSMANAYLRGRGFATDMPGPVTGFVKSSSEVSLPDLQIMLRVSPAMPHPWFPGWRKPFQDALGAWVVLLAPESRGELRLASADPSEPLKIFQNFYTKEADRRVMREGLRTARRIFAEAPLSEMVGEEIAPGNGAQDDASLDAHVRATAVTVSHPLGTCRMGVDEEAVVDQNLRVNGLDRLRIVDASVMPDLVGGNLNATVIAMAEKAADLIKQAA